MGETAARNETPRASAALVEQELVSSVAWLISIRWFAGLGVLAATWFTTAILGIRLPSGALYAVGLAILVYNAIFRIALTRLQWPQLHDVGRFDLFTKLQIALDYLAMTALLHYSGGLESPAVLYFFFHIVIAAILLSQNATYLYSAMAIVLVAGTAGLEYAGIIPHVHVAEFITSEQYRVPVYVMGKLFFFASTVIVAAFLASTLNSRLRRREAQVVELGERLQRAYGRLETLYESAKAVNSTLELQQVLDRLVQATAQAMGVRACSIRLLDESGTRMHIAASYGLSETYAKKGDLLLERNPLMRQALAGKTIITNDVAAETQLQYPAEAAAEGIRSMLTSPLSGKAGPLGLIRAYSVDRGHFTQEDATFLSAIASQGSVAIENAMSYQALGKLDETKSKFVLTVTHELRSPVSVIRSLLRTMLAGYTGALSDEQRDIVSRALRRTDFLQNLIDDLLDLAAGKSDLALKEERIEVKLEEAVELLIKQFEVSAAEKRIRLEWECEHGGQALSVSATNEGIDRILGNLLSNAIKYTSAGGRVAVKLRRVNSEAYLEVSDTGVGIAEDAMPHLFEEFYRAPNAKALEKEGTGLGLAIVKDLVTHYGGRIAVRSQVGQGSTFTVILPLTHT